MKTKKITKKDNISEVIRKNPKAAEILFESGLGCCGCPIAQQETIEEGCLAHGIEPDRVIAQLNKASTKKKSK